MACKTFELAKVGVLIAIQSDCTTFKDFDNEIDIDDGVTDLSELFFQPNTDITKYINNGFAPLYSETPILAKVTLDEVEFEPQSTFSGNKQKVMIDTFARFEFDVEVPLVDLSVAKNSNLSIKNLLKIAHLDYNDTNPAKIICKPSTYAKAKATIFLIENTKLYAIKNAVGSFELSSNVKERPMLKFKIYGELQYELDIAEFNTKYNPTTPIVKFTPPLPEVPQMLFLGKDGIRVDSDSFDANALTLNPQNQITHIATYGSGSGYYQSSYNPIITIGGYRSMEFSDKIATVVNQAQSNLVVDFANKVTLSATIKPNAVADKQEKEGFIYLSKEFKAVGINGDDNFTLEFKI